VPNRSSSALPRVLSVNSITSKSLPSSRATNRRAVFASVGKSKGLLQKLIRKPRDAVGVVAVTAQVSIITDLGRNAGGPLNRYSGVNYRAVPQYRPRGRTMARELELAIKKVFNEN
jgi:hypothetical protein